MRSGRRSPTTATQVALENARTICQAARNAGTTVTLDMEDHTTTDSHARAILRELRKDFPETGAVLQAYLRRTEADCRDLAYEGSRVRLCKGAYNEPESVAFQDGRDVDKSYVRCLKVLMAGDRATRWWPPTTRGWSRSPRPWPAATTVAPGTYEFQMLFGVRADEQKRLADARRARCASTSPTARSGTATSMRRLAERPANLPLLPAVAGLQEVRP